MTTDIPLDQSALVIIGHGSKINSNSGDATRQQVDEIRRRGIFAEVDAGFWKEAPSMAEALDRVTAPQVFVVPNLACKGFITNDVIPREMGLSGPVSERTGPNGTQRIRLCDPVGTHPRMAEIIAARAGGIIAEHDLASERTCLLLAGHGSSRNRQSSIQTQAVADALRAKGIFSCVATGFLEQEPLIADWHAQMPAENIIVVPFMISNGLHGAEDIPALLGLDPKDPALARMAEDGTPAGPYAVRDRRLWYCRAIGCEAGVADIIIEQARRGAQAG